MRCYFLRHGIAVEAETWSGSEFDRPLTGEGRERMEREAKAIADLRLGLHCIVTSPMLRAKETAQIVASRSNVPGGVIEDERLAGDFNLARLRAILTQHAGAPSIM